MTSYTKTCIYLFVDACRCVGTFIHAVTEFYYRTVNVSAESVGGPTPGVRVTWNTTVPPECVGSVRVEFRTRNIRDPVVATTNTSETEVIQTGLQCATNYYIKVLIFGKLTGGTPKLDPSHSDVQVFVGGIKKTSYLHLILTMAI